MPESHPLRILFIEDETSFLLATQMFLVRKGYNVDTCETGEDALPLLKERSYDLILLDYMLPGMSGLNVMQWVHEQKLDTPVVVLTGAGSEEIAVEFMKLGAYDYIRKDLFDRDHLPVLVNSVHERYLFRQDKEERSKSESGTGKSMLIVDMYSKGVNTLSHILGNALSLIVMNIEEQSKEFLPSVKESRAKEFQRLCDDMHRHYTLIADGIRSLMMLTEAFRDGIMKGRETGELESIMKENLRSLETEFDDIQKENGKG